MATDFNKAIISGGGFKPSTTDTPIDVRTRIESIREVELIPNPYVGMLFYVRDEGKYYSVKSLKSLGIGGFEVPNARIDVYVVFGVDPTFLEKVEEVSNSLSLVEERVSALESVILANKEAIRILNADADTDGSVDNKIATAFAWKVHEID